MKSKTSCENLHIQLNLTITYFCHLCCLYEADVKKKKKKNNDKETENYVTKV